MQHASLRRDRPAAAARRMLGETKRETLHNARRAREEAARQAGERLERQHAEQPRRKQARRQRQPEQPQREQARGQRQSEEEMPTPTTDRPPVFGPPHVRRKRPNPTPLISVDPRDEKVQVAVGEPD